MIVAPFLGEFGWEVALWVPWLRGQRNRHHKGGDFIVFCKPGHEGLYTDFASAVRPIEVNGVTRVDCQLVWVEELGKLDKDAYGDLVEAELETHIGAPKLVRKRMITPLDMRYSWDHTGPPVPGKQCEFRQLAAGPRDDRLSVIHARSCEKKQPERNWGFNKWAELVEQIGGHVASIGTVGQSLHMPGTENMRGVPLKELIEILGSSRVVVGPSSGPLHLANHCGMPAVWWSGNAKDQSRYETFWNPFELPNRCASATWDPDVDEVAACLMNPF